MRKLSTEKRTMILATLTEGVSINATARLCRVSKLTVLRLLNDVGVLCRDYHDLVVRDLESARIQLDECWSFVGGKAKAKRHGAAVHGDCWVWVALDADTKLVVSYYVGDRDGATANDFVMDVSERIANKPQITADGFKAYPEAIENAFGGWVDFAVLTKIYAADREGEARYSPSVCIGCKSEVVSGRPDPRHVSTSFVERQNLALRTRNKRLGRLTLSFSKKLTNHAHAIALHYWVYNFATKHGTLGMTPAQAAGIADRQMTVDDLVRMLEAEETRRAKGGRLNRADRT